MIFLWPATLFALNFFSYFISPLFSLTGFFCRSSVSPTLYCQNSLYSLHSLPFFPDCLWIQCIAEHCKRLLAVSLPVKTDHLCLPSVVCFQLVISPGEGSPIYLLAAELPKFSGYLNVTLYCSFVTAINPQPSTPLWTERFCPSSQPCLMLPSSTPAAVQRIQSGNRSGWKWTQQITN